MYFQPIFSRYYIEMLIVGRINLWIKSLKDERNFEWFERLKILVFKIQAS